MFIHVLPTGHRDVKNIDHKVNQTRRTIKWVLKIKTAFDLHFDRRSCVHGRQCYSHMRIAKFGCGQPTFLFTRLICQIFGCINFLQIAPSHFIISDLLKLILKHYHYPISLFVIHYSLSHQQYKKISYHKYDYQATN